MNKKNMSEIEKRTIKSAKYYLKNKSSIKKTAEHFNISVSTLHHDLVVRLPKLNNKLYKKVLKQINDNKNKNSKKRSIINLFKYLK